MTAGVRVEPGPGIGAAWSRLHSGFLGFFFFLADSGLIEAKSWLSQSAELTALNLKRKFFFTARWNRGGGSQDVHRRDHPAHTAAGQ